MPEEITPPAPRILILAGAPHPQALVQSVDAATGVCVFAWLNSEGAQVDSGGSVARFIVSWEPGELPDERIYIEPTDAELAEAIANPPAEVAPVPASVTRRQLFLWLNTQGITRATLAAQLAGNEAALIELQEATEFLRTHPLVGQLGVALGLNDAQIDTAFIAAAQL